MNPREGYSKTTFARHMDNNNTSQVPILWATYPAAINATDIYGQTPIQHL